MSTSREFCVCWLHTSTGPCSKYSSFLSLFRQSILAMMQTNYFVCTLGQASALTSRPKPYRTISEFLDLQAKHHAYMPAVGFLNPQSNQELWTYQVLTFGDVHQGAKALAQRLSHVLSGSKKSKTVALLCHSSPEFLFTWLALMKLGYAVLLIAPQCQPAAILHLCKGCQVSVLFHDEAHIEKARNTELLARDEGHSGYKAVPLPLQTGEDIFECIKVPVKLDIEIPETDGRATAYLHHTSGTSSGLPKPIPQSHQGALGVLPHLPETPGIASFTTTPLYHGGIADLFRCWTSNALIWMFPGKDVPITARNICQCLLVANSYSSEKIIPKVKYFSSVPYVLQMMEADENGLQWLQQMEIVGVGGAALPTEVGDTLVKKGVNLISRFGSAECGFLLSSFRDFATDQDWQYLRNYNPPKLVDFEPRDDGLAELIVKPGWPHMVG
jgi:acyl-coenzyme A synthetase/AMP-(fatty) acid ligase